MISHDKKFIFVHVPRTGGTSLETVFERTVSDCEVENDTRHWPLWFYYKSTISKTAYFDKSLVRSFVSPDEYFKFSIARNPWDRFLSYFFHLYQGEFHAPTFKKMIRLAGKSGFGMYPFVRPQRLEHVNFNSCTRMMAKLINTDEYKFDTSGMRNIPPKVEEITDSSSQYVNLGLGVDYVLRFENLEEDFVTLCDKLDLPRQKLPHENKTKRRNKDYREYYTEETKSIIAKQYQDDIKKFNYIF